MAQLTTLPVGFGYFFGYFPAIYGWAIGSQAQYNALSDGAKSGIKGAWSTVGEAVSAITATNPIEPVVIYILDRATDVSGIPSTINGQPVIVDYSFAPSLDVSFGFGFGFTF